MEARKSSAIRRRQFNLRGEFALVVNYPLTVCVSRLNEVRSARSGQMLVIEKVEATAWQISETSYAFLVSRVNRYGRTVAEIGGRLEYVDETSTLILGSTRNKGWLVLPAVLAVA